MIPEPSGTVIRRSHRTVGSNRSATTDPFPPLESDLPVSQLTMWLLSTDSPVSPAFLRQVIRNFPSFKGSSDLWIFKLDGLPLRCDAKPMFDHPHSRLPSLLNSFLLRRNNMPSLPSYGMGPQVIVLYSDFISPGGNFLVTVLT